VLPVRGVLARAAGGQPVGVVDLQGRVVPLVDIIVRVRRARTGVVGVDGSPDPPVEGIVAVVELHEPSTLLPRLTLLDKPAVATARNLPLFLLDRSLLTSGCAIPAFALTRKIKSKSSAYSLTNLSEAATRLVSSSLM